MDCVGGSVWTGRRGERVEYGEREDIAVLTQTSGRISVRSLVVRVSRTLTVSITDHMAVRRGINSKTVSIRIKKFYRRTLTTGPRGLFSISDRLKS